MKRIVFLAVAVAMFGPAIRSSAQSLSSIRSEVHDALIAIKPRNTKHYRYEVKVPPAGRAIPDNLRVDLVYKIGHYDFKYVAVRFEMRGREPLVDVSYFSYGSALAFWREIRKSADTFTAKQGKLPVDEFDRLMTTAFLYLDSEITKTYIPRVRRDGSSVGFGGSTATYSSGDGRILLGLDTGKAFDQPLLRKTGSLLEGSDLRSRMDEDYDNLRPHLFWKVFYDYLEKANLLAIKTEDVESKVIGRLLEPALSPDYTDYFRQALFVELLAEYGTARSLSLLRKLRANSGLDADWHTHLQKHLDRAEKHIDGGP